MTEGMLALIKHRIKQADDSIEEAKVLLKENMSLRKATSAVSDTKIDISRGKTYPLIPS